MEDKTVKTIDFLRARLLAERSVSRTARQRAYELAKRVTELEKQLKYVSLQRKKAEKATVDVLLILENHGRNDLSETFDSSSDQEEISSQHAETSAHVKPQESEFSSSEVESSRSLSWKSSKNSSSRFLEKKYTDASRRRRNSSFTSTGSSPRRVGKSCRQIRHREHRSTGDVSQNDDVANGHCEDEGRTNSEGVKNHGSEKDMERALEEQAQFIARYEAEEKAQREWEDKFRENNGSTPDSCDPGTHSDVTEERDEIKAPTPVPVQVLPCCNDKTTPGSRVIDAKLSEEPNIESEPILDTKNSDMHNKVSDNKNHPPDFQGTPTHFSPEHVSSSQESRLYKGEQTSGKSYEPTQNPGQLGSVLEALQQAKLSLKSLEKFPVLQNGPSVPTYRSMEKFPVPVSPVGLFRLPIDYEYGETTPTPRANNSLTYDSRLSLTSQHTGSSGGQLGQFVSSPYTGSLSSSSASLDDRFRMVPTFPYQETRLETGPSALDPRLGVGPTARDPRLNVGVGLSASALDPRLGVGPSVHDPRLNVGSGPSARDPRFEVGLGPSARDPRLDMGLGQFARDSRLGVGPSAFDPRLEMGPTFTGDRYMRSVDSPPQARSLYGDYIRPNTYK